MLNAQTEENDFIETDMTTTDVMSYKPQLDQELQCNKGDEAFDYLYDMMNNDLETRMQGKYDFVILDEADSMLIDDASTPHIISSCIGQVNTLCTNKLFVDYLKYTL